jgi:hypothetical protein
MTSLYFSFQARLTRLRITDQSESIDKPEGFNPTLIFEDNESPLPAARRNVLSKKG